MVNYENFATADLEKVVSDLMENTTYKRRIEKASAIFHSEKHPTERAADAVERVLTYGADHLQYKETFKLNWWQLYLMEIFAIIISSFLFSFYATFKLLQCLMKRIRCPRRKQKKRVTFQLQIQVHTYMSL